MARYLPGRFAILIATALAACATAPRDDTTDDRGTTAEAKQRNSFLNNCFDGTKMARNDAAWAFAEIAAARGKIVIQPGALAAALNGVALQSCSADYKAGVDLRTAIEHAKSDVTGSVEQMRENTNTPWNRLFKNISSRQLAA